MIRKIVLSLLIVFSSVNTFSQSDTLNQFDSNGEKTGWWIIYLNDNFEKQEDSVGATHLMYDYRTGWFSHYSWGQALESKKHSVYFPDNDTLKVGRYTLLNGDYITKYKDGTIRSVLSASNGILIEYKKFWPNGQLDDHFIYSAECGAPIHTCLLEYNKKGELVYEGYLQVPKKARDNTNPCSDTNESLSGTLDGNSYLIEVKQETGEKHEPQVGWPIDTLLFDFGKLYSVYMQERERFCPSVYSPSTSKIESDSLINFKYENSNPGGSFLQIIGTVLGTTIKGTISWTSGAKNITRTYSFEGTLI